MLGGNPTDSLGDLASDLASDLAPETQAARGPAVRVPVSAPPSAEPVPRESVKETHVSGRFRAVERERPMPIVPPPLPPTRKKLNQ